MSIPTKLQRIPLDADFTYTDYKGAVFNSCRDYKRAGASPVGCINSVFENACATEIEKGGMEKFVDLLSGLLYEIKYNDIDPDLVHEVAWDIADFETGEYDDLFTEKDLAALKKDVEFVKSYIRTNYEQICKEAMKHREEKQKNH